MLKRIWNSVTYYFRLDFVTIQGRLTSGFMGLAMITICVVLFNHWQWKRISQDRDYLLHVIDPSMAITQQLLSEAENTYDYIEITTNDSRRQWDTLWSREILPLEDSLLEFQEQWRDDVGEELLENVIAELDYIQRNQNEVLENVSGLMSEDRMYTKLRERTKLLISHFNAVKTEQLATTEKRIDQMDYVIAGSFIIAVLIALLLGTSIITSILAKIRSLKHYIRDISEGNLPEELPQTKDELNTIVKSINILVENLRHITDFAHAVGKGEFASNVTVFNNQGQLGHSLAEMRESLKDVDEDNKKRRWFNEGIAQFSDILRTNSHDLNVLADVVIRELVKILGCNQGALFIINEKKEDDPILEMRGLYAYGRKKYMFKEIRPGQGLAGQAFRERERILLKEIPENYTEISSGLGDSTPTYLAVMPLITNEKVYGIVEMASFRDLEPHEVDFLEKVSENIASTIAAVTISHETNKLLEESQMAAEQLRAQEEEMRQNAEELEATQEEIHRQMREASEQRDMFVSLLENVDGVIYRSKYDATWTKMYVSENVERITGYPSSVFLEHNKSFAEIIHPDDLPRVNEVTEDSLEHKQKWNLEYRMLRRDGTTIWVEEKGKGVYDDEGRVQFIDGMIMDVTHRKQGKSTQEANGGGEEDE